MKSTEELIEHLRRLKELDDALQAHIDDGVPIDKQLANLIADSKELDRHIDRKPERIAELERLRKKFEAKLPILKLADSKGISDAKQLLEMAKTGLAKIGGLIDSISSEQRIPLTLPGLPESPDIVALAKEFECDFEQACALAYWVGYSRGSLDTNELAKHSRSRSKQAVSNEEVVAQLARNGSNISQTARALGIKRATLEKRIGAMQELTGVDRERIKGIFESPDKSAN